MRTVSILASTQTDLVDEELNVLLKYVTTHLHCRKTHIYFYFLSSTKHAVYVLSDSRATPWWHVLMLSVGLMTTVVKTKHVTSSVRHVSPCVGQTRVPRMPRVLASTTTPSARVTPAPEAMLSSELAVLDVRWQQEFYRILLLINFHFSHCSY